MYQNFISRHLSNLFGWYNSSCKLATCPLRSSPIDFKASSLGPDSPRASPRNETVKQCRRQMTVANSPVQWPSWTWCRTWWNHLWHSSRVTLNQRCFAFIHPRTPLVYRSCHFANSEPQRCFWLLPIGMEQNTPRVVVWQLSNFCIGRIEYGPDGRHRLTKQVQLERLRSENTPALSPWTNFKLGLP